MILIGAAVLSDYGAKQPHAFPALRALNALIRQARWPDAEAFAQSCGAVMRSDGGVTLLALRDARCEVAVKVNYDLGVVRIVAVRDLQRT